MIKKNKEVTLKTRETFFFYKKPEKTETCEKFSLFLVSRIVPKKKQKVASYRRYKLSVSFRMG